VQQPDIRNGQQIAGAVPLDQPPFDLCDFGTERSAKPYASNVVDVEGDSGSDLGGRSPGGLQ
jgi:hypothetical protein